VCVQPLRTLKARRFMAAQGVSRLPACRFDQLQFKLNRFANTSSASRTICSRVLPKLPIEAWIVVCVDATLESSSVIGSIKEPRRNTQRANPIANVPCSTDLIAFAIHVIGSVTSNALNCA
jgi:hypothetical protein